MICAVNSRRKVLTLVLIWPTKTNEMKLSRAGIACVSEWDFDNSMAI